MKKFFALIFVVFPLIAFGQGTPDITLRFPYTDVAKGQSVTVTWIEADSDTTEYTVKLAGPLLTPARTVGTIDTTTAENITLTIPNDVPAGSGYVIQFVSSNGTAYPSTTFSITGVTNTQIQQPVVAEQPNMPQTQPTTTSPQTTSLIQEIKRIQDEITKKAVPVNQVTISASCITLSSDIGYGAKDTNQKVSVATLQSFLYEKGYLPVKPTGFFGTKTVLAIAKFQKDQSIRLTGMAGPITRGRIQQMTCSQ
jgi:Putative peptidoglycan binding domain/Ser-Thr-rich glycosyl-phosphatidyl-inositol-anchored membrane family